MPNKLTIPLLDLSSQYIPLKKEILEAISTILDTKQFINGPNVEKCEAAIASYSDTNFGIGVTSGSDALIASLIGLDIKPGDEVITTPFTFFATVGAISRVGAIPVFVDINPKTFNINPYLIEEKITKKTRAIIPVHLFGQMADMDPIMKLAKIHNLAVIEDAAQSIGATYKEKKSGSIGDVGCLSFFPSKNLGCCGDGGMIVTQNEMLAKKLKSIRNHGEVTRYHHQFIGGNFRLDALQAAILLLKLPELDRQHNQRKINASFYNTHLKNVTIPYIDPSCDTIYNQYSIRTKTRDSLCAHLKENQIDHAIYYPRPMHLQECFVNLGYKIGDFPESEKAANEILSIPIYPGLSEKQLSYVATTINKAPI